MSAPISSICFATVRAESGTCAIFSAADSPKTSLQISVHVGKINSSSIVNGLLALVMRRDTKYDAFIAFIFGDRAEL